MRIVLMMLLPIGDTLFATPAVHALRKRYPAAHMTAVVYPTNKGILVDNPDIDEFIVWPTRQSWAGFLRVGAMFWKLWRARYDLAVEFCNYIGWVSLVTGVRKRTEMNLPFLWWCRPSAGVKWRCEHAVEHYAHPVRRIGVPLDDWQLRITPSDRDEARAQAWLDNYGVSPDELLVGIHPGGEGLWGRKQWGVRGFAKVADGLSERLGARIMLMGGKDDSPLAAQIAARSRARIINATGQTTLGETAALARRCTLFIGNDSSPLHIAAASGTKVVGIYGPTDPRSYHPWIPGGREGVDYAVVRSSLPCACGFSFIGGITLAAWIRCLLCPALTAITPNQVLKAALGLIKAARPAAGS